MPKSHWWVVLNSIDLGMSSFGEEYTIGGIVYYHPEAHVWWLFCDISSHLLPLFRSNNSLKVVK